MEHGGTYYKCLYWDINVPHQFGQQNQLSGTTLSPLFSPWYNYEHIFSQLFLSYMQFWCVFGHFVKISKTPYTAVKQQFSSIFCTKMQRILSSIITIISGIWWVGCAWTQLVQATVVDYLVFKNMHSLSHALLILDWQLDVPVQNFTNVVQFLYEENKINDQNKCFN